jgi:hypothetical protein
VGGRPSHLSIKKLLDTLVFEIASHGVVFYE